MTVKKNTVLFFIASVIAIAACSPANNKKKHQELVNKSETDTTFRTSIKWVDSVVDLGTITSGEKKQIKFRCLNTGNKPLVLLEVSPGCGCTVASFSDGEIQPGKEGWVNATFDSKGKCDDVFKTIAVKTNAQPENLFTIGFKAHIIGCPSNDKEAPRLK